MVILEKNKTWVCPDCGHENDKSSLVYLPGKVKTEGIVAECDQCTFKGMVSEFKGRN